MSRSFGWQVGHLTIADRDLARRHVLESGQDPQDRRLPATGWADQHHELTVTDLKGDVVHGDHIVPEYLGDAVEDDLAPSLSLLPSGQSVGPQAFVGQGSAGRGRGQAFGRSDDRVPSAPPRPPEDRSARARRAAGDRMEGRPRSVRRTARSWLRKIPPPKTTSTSSAACADGGSPWSPWSRSRRPADRPRLALPRRRPCAALNRIGASSAKRCSSIRSK